ncbi:MAG: 50S ribosomal protein L11 methyltransferase [Bacteriovoracia bacterium]
MSETTFRFHLNLPKTIYFRERPRTREGRVFNREEVFAWIWANLAQYGLLGIHEGTQLAPKRGKVLDSAVAPTQRDWVASAGPLEAVLYFNSNKGARTAVKVLETHFDGLSRMRVFEQRDKNWNEAWQKNFRAVEIPPFWKVVPPWDASKLGSDALGIVINPGAGFGTGTHETTRLCLEAIGEMAAGLESSQPFAGKRVLDFGSGSGLLGIGCALLGAQAECVEVDPLAIDNAEGNVKLNGVGRRVRFQGEINPKWKPFDLVVANILKPVLLEFAPALTRLLAPRGVLILSGLLHKDEAPVRKQYAALLPQGYQFIRGEEGDWCALIAVPGARETKVRTKARPGAKPKPSAKSTKRRR